VKTIFHRMRRPAAGLFLAACIMAVGAPAKEAAPANDSTLCERGMNLLERAYASLHSLEAHFKHSLVSKTLGQKTEEEGTLYLARGGRMRWDYSSPKGKVALSDGRKTYLYLPSENQLYEQPLPTGPSAPITFRLLSGEADLGREFTCGGARVEKGEIVMTLDLRHPAAQVKAVTIALDAASGLIREVRYQDALENRVTLVFSDIRTGKALPKGIFQFKAPPGVRTFRNPRS
jgi:outer membrane lipoprotein carrier protein